MITKDTIMSVVDPLNDTGEKVLTLKNSFGGKSAEEIAEMAKSYNWNCVYVEV